MTTKPRGNRVDEPIDVLLTEKGLPADLSVGSMEDEDGDGAVFVFMGEEAPEVEELAQPEGHLSNLAEFLSEDSRKEIARKIIQWVEDDTKSRELWSECLKNGMETLGIAEIGPDDKPLAGASTVTHPIITEAAVQFQSRAIEELFPSTGPVKCKTIPMPDPDILAQAERVEGFFNYYLTDVDEGYYDDSDKMLFLLALHGHIFRKTYVCPITGMPKSRHVTASDLLVPYEANSLQDADHYTHSYTMPLNDVRRAMQSGYFRQVEITEAMLSGVEQTEERESQDESDRREPLEWEGAIPQLYECHCDLVLDEIDEGEDSGERIALPYIVTIEKNTEKVLSIYRNWEEDDARRLKQVWFSSYKYLQGLGFYGLGLFHVLGNIAQSAGAMLRALIDSAANVTAQGGFIAKQPGGRKMDLEIEKGVYKEVDMTAEELAKAFYSPPFKEPSQTMVLLLRDLIETARRFSSTTEAMVGDGPSSGPVGTTLALIEQGSKVFTAIHKRMHRSLAMELRALAKLFRRMNMDYPYPVGPHNLMQDLDSRVDIMPVSDPTIVSNTQRIAMAQAAQQIVRNDPELYGPENRRMVDLALLKVMKVPNAEQIVKPNEQPPPPELDPVSENEALLTGKPIKAYEQQDHDAHIQTHINFFQALPPVAQKQLEGPALAHVAEHAAMKYRQQMMAAMQQMPPGMSPEQAMAAVQVPPLVPQLTPPPMEPPVV